VYAPENEIGLLTELKSGSESAFKFLYDNYSIQLYRRIFKLVKIEVIAQELLQDLFVKIWEKRELIDPTRSFRSYLYTIAERLVYDHFRCATRLSRLAKEVSQHTSELYTHTEEGIFEMETRNRIAEAINRLPEQQKLIFNLCKMEGLSYSQVSKQLGISTATINTHITRATKAIKLHLQSSEHLPLIIFVAASYGCTP